MTTKDEDLKGKLPIPRNSRKGCLCKDGTYSRKCCKGKSIWEQGVGKI